MFRPIKESDRELYLKYVDIFYHTDAVNSPVPKENYTATFNELMRSDDYLKCYIFEWEGKPCGFSLLSKTFSQEATDSHMMYVEQFFELVELRDEIGRLRADFARKTKEAENLLAYRGNLLE